MLKTWKFPLQVLLLTSALSCTRAHLEEPGGQNADAALAYHRYSQLTLQSPLADVEEAFNLFSGSYFGAKSDPIYHSTFGEQISIKEGHWSYVSETSASLFWETNLPAKSFVEYGEADVFDQITDVQERHYFLHLHYLKNLKPDTEYMYRVVAEDEFGTRVTSEAKKFRTQRLPNAIRIPDDLGEPPYVLDQPNATYLVTADIVGKRSLIVVAAENVTIDLGGNTLIHADEQIADADFNDLERSGVGIRWRDNNQKAGLKIFNGTLRQGSGNNNTALIGGDSMLKPDPETKDKYHGSINRGFSNIEISSKGDIEIAGVTAIYHLPQSWGMRFEGAFGVYNVHHNVFSDRGNQMFDRHGAGGSRSMGFVAGDDGSWDSDNNNFSVHHNLIKRTRQNAINVAEEIHHNEIYVDSWVVNSFGIQPSNSNGRVYDNKIFLTGYYACGILWASKHLQVSDNFIHMEGVRTMIDKPNEGRRLIETWGEQDVLAGMRITNYGKGGQERENLLYRNNVIFGRSRDGAELRGTEFFSDFSNKDIVFTDNIVKIQSMDTLPSKSSTINTQGAYNDRSSHLPMLYSNTVSMSDLCNIRFGDDYGQGSNHQFVSCRIVKTGDHPDYHTFKFDGGNSVFNHVLLDCQFEQGAQMDDVYWERTGSLSNYSVKWTLDIETIPLSEIVIRDKNGKVHFQGQADAQGHSATALTQYIIRPTEWEEGKEEVPVTDKSSHQKEAFSPYSVEVSYAGKILRQDVELDRKTQITIQ